MDQSALKIYQEFLDHMSDALLRRDEEAFLRHIFMPHTIQTETTFLTVDTREVAIQHFHGFATALAAQNVDAYTRIAREAWFDTEDHIIGRHDSFMTSQGKLVVPQFSNEAELERRNDVWGSTKTRHLARYVSWPDILPRPTGKPT